MVRGPGLGRAAPLLAALLLLGAGCGSASLKQDAGGTGGASDGGAGGRGSGGAVTSTGGNGAGGSGAGGTTPDAAADRGTSPDLAPDALPPDAGIDAGACTRPRTCNVLHACSPAAASGNYMIFPDGAADAGLLVHCDMETGGGGWTVIFLADAINLTTAPGYTVPNQSLRDAARETLVGFRNLNLNKAISDWASFDLPPSWRLTNPLAATPYEELSIPSVSINGAPPGSAVVRYGQSNFGALCNDAWVTDSPYGRFCIQGTVAAFYSGFTVDTIDYCVRSNETYSTRACSDTARFSIAVR